MNKNFFKQHFIKIIILAFTLLVSLLLFVTNNLPVFHSKGIAFHTDSPSPEPLYGLTESVVISQQFKHANDSLSDIEILFGTYGRVNTNNLTIELNNLTKNELVYTWNVSTESFIDNEFVRFTLPNTLHNVKNHIFSLSIDFNGATLDNTVALFTSPQDYDDDFKLFKNNELLNGAIVFKTYHMRTDYLGVLYFFILVASLNAIFVLTLLCLFKKIKHIHMDSLKSTILSILTNKTKRLLALCFILIPFLSILIEYVFSHYIRVVPLSTHRLFNWYRYTFLVSSLYVIFAIIVSHKNNIDRKPEKTFLALSLTIGLLFILTLPNVTNVSWDDQIHYKRIMGIMGIRSNRVSQMDLALAYNYNPKTQDNFESLQDYLEGFPFPITFNISEINETNAKLNELHKMGFEKEAYVNYGQAYEYIAYYPTAFFIAIGRVLSLPYPFIFMMGRLANLLFYSFIMYFAIKKLKTGKMILATVAMIPTCLFIACIYNYDYWLISLTALGLSYFFSILHSKSEGISKKDLILSVLALVAGLGPKAIYFPLLLILYLGIRNNKKWFSVLLTLSIVFVIFSFMVPFVFNPGDMTDLRGGADVNSPEQVKFILRNPFTYAGILINFLKGYLSLDNAYDYIKNFAYLGLGAGSVLYTMVLVFTSLSDNGDFNRDGKIKLLRTKVLGIVMFTIILVVTALYISFTPLASPYVLGCQPRYLLPLLFPVLYVLGTSFHVIQCNVSRKTYNTAIFSLCSFVVLYSYWIVCISRYY